MAIQNISDRAAAYGIAGVTIDGNDPEAVYEVTRAAVERALSGEGPTLIEAKTYRFAPHTSDDDDKGYRPPDEIARWKRERDPIARYAARLARRGLLDDAGREAIEARVRQAITEASRQAEAMPDPAPTDLATEIFAAK
jgi:2-oxoisovalerate dehydrogenase E1 component alpha subunit